jgi:hypothetical protein
MARIDEQAALTVTGKLDELLKLQENTLVYLTEVEEQVQSLQAQLATVQQQLTLIIDTIGPEAAGFVMTFK